MPELPEVETVCRGLNEQLMPHAQIASVHVRERRLRVPIAAALEKKLINKKILGLRRRAKYLLFDCEGGVLITHLGMSGSWRLTGATDQHLSGLTAVADRNLTKAKRKSLKTSDQKLPNIDLKKHDHFIIRLKDGRHLIYHDPRRFGLIEHVAAEKVEQSRWLKHLGVEPLTEEFSGEHLKRHAEGKSTLVKTFIMDQKVVVGVGNIYASEALYFAGVRPQKRVNKVKLEDWNKIAKAIKKVLNHAIEHKGTTLQDYRQSTGESGGFQNELYVYERAKQLCRVCNEIVSAKKMAGRSTYWCGACQE